MLVLGGSDLWLVTVPFFAWGLWKRGGQALHLTLFLFLTLGAFVLVMVNSVPLALLVVGGLALTMATFVGLLYLRTRDSGHGARASEAPDRSSALGSRRT